MKYLISKKIRIGDLNSFVENYEGEFVREPSLERLAAVAEAAKAVFFRRDSGVSVSSVPISLASQGMHQAVLVSRSAS